MTKATAIAALPAAPIARPRLGSSASATNPGPRPIARSAATPRVDFVWSVIDLEPLPERRTTGQRWKMSLGAGPSSPPLRAEGPRGARAAWNEAIARQIDGAVSAELQTLRLEERALHPLGQVGEPVRRHAARRVDDPMPRNAGRTEIGRASCRERDEHT